MSGRRLPPVARRRQIVDAARTIIVERGLAATSLRDIARAAEVSIGTVTYHFRGVDEVLSEVVIGESERFYADVVRRADAEPDAWAALRILIEPLFAESDDVRAHWRIWSDYWAVVARRPEVAAAYVDRIHYWEACCTRIIARGITAGQFGRVDPAQTALKLAAYSDGLGTQRAQRAASLTGDIAAAWMDEFVRVLLEP